MCGKQHPDTLTSTTNLAIIRGDQGYFAEAERLLRESLRWKQEQLGANHPSTSVSRSNLVGLLRPQSRNQEASAIDEQKPECWSKESQKPRPSVAFLQYKCLDFFRDLKGFIRVFLGQKNEIPSARQYGRSRRDDVTVASYRLHR